MRLVDVNNISQASKINAISISQNQLDLIHSCLSSFCKQHDQYKWFALLDNKKVLDIDRLASRNVKNQPETLRYVVGSEVLLGKLDVEIKYGITIVIVNGSLELYGLYSYLKYCLGKTGVPNGMFWAHTYLRIILPVCLLLLFLSALYFNFGLVGLVAWIAATFLTAYRSIDLIHNDKKDYIELKWKNFRQTTKVNYGKYRVNGVSPVLASFTSINAIISILASLATVATFVLYFIIGQK